MTDAIASPPDSRISTSGRDDQVNNVKGTAFLEHHAAAAPIAKSSSQSHGIGAHAAASHHGSATKEGGGSKDHHRVASSSSSSGMEKKKKEGDRAGDAERKREHDPQARQENGHDSKKPRLDERGSGGSSSREHKLGGSSTSAGGSAAKPDGAVVSKEHGSGEKKREHHGGEHRKEHGGEKKKEHGGERKKEHGGERKKEHGGERKKEHGGERKKEHGGERKKEHGGERKEHGGEKKKEHGGEKRKEHGGEKRKEEHGVGEKKKEHGGSDKSRDPGHKGGDSAKDKPKHSGLTNGVPASSSSEKPGKPASSGSAGPDAAKLHDGSRKELTASAAKPSKSASGSSGGVAAKQPEPVAGLSSSAGKAVKQEVGSPVKVSSSSSGLFSETVSETRVKAEVESDDDMPLAKRKETAAKSTSNVKVSSSETVAVKKRKLSESDDAADNAALANSTNNAKKVKVEMEVKKKIKTKETETKNKIVKQKVRTSDDEDDFKGKKKPAADGIVVVKEKTKRELKKEIEVKEVWRWWEEERRDDNVKWKFLEHKGPLIAPAYEPLPSSVQFKYDGKPYKLEEGTEEVAGFYARMIEHEYTTRDIFNKNFMKDWRQVMSAREREHITDLKKCDFRAINEYYKQKSEEKKAMSKEEKAKIKEQNEKIVEEYGFCKIDGHTEKIGNFRVEPPGLFRGRGDHPKQGMLKRRVMPEDIIINCSKDSKAPVPPHGHKWKEVRHDNEVTWLASWTENIQGQVKYVMLNASSKVKGEKDWMKYETARKLHKCIDKIRNNYQEDLRSKEMRIRQRAVALYFIDKLALRAGNEKDSDEQADTVGCCSLRVEHVTLHDELDGKECVVEFDFLGKDSIRYQNKVPVEKRAYKNVKLFMENKQPGDLLFDRLNTTILNKHLQDLLEGLTAKVFRTYNASRTLEEQLEKMTDPNDTVAAKMLAYNRANRAVAILCNHQRAAPKNFEQQMLRMQEKIKEKQQQVKDAKRELKESRDKSKDSPVYQKKKKQIERLEDQLAKLEVQATDKDENKEIALSTSKLNYLDPRISVAWCKRFDVPVEKVYNKTQRQKFMWALDMAEADFSFRT